MSGYEDLIAEIDRARLARSMTRIELARLTDYSSAGMSLILSGKRIIPANRLLDIAASVGLRIVAVPAASDRYPTVSTRKMVEHCNAVDARDGLPCSLHPGHLARHTSSQGQGPTS